MSKGSTGEIPNSVGRETVFDPESIKVLAFALEFAWSRIRRSRSWLARPAYARATREVLAKRIFEMARQGVKDPQTLADDAERFLRANYRHACNSKGEVSRGRDGTQVCGCARREGSGAPKDEGCL